MSAVVREPLRKLISTHESGGHLLIMCDYDGTLVPLVDHPDLAVISDRTRQALIRLTRAPRVFVGIFSGRELSNLKRIVGIPELYYAGTSGLEIEFGGTQATHPQAGQFQSRLKGLAECLEQLLQGHAGAWLERKQYGLTIHYRAVSTAFHSALFAQVRECLAPHEEQLRALPGPMAVEITPALDWNKGTAVERLSRGIAPRQYTTLYAGDSHNDCEAFAAVTAQGGVTVGVGDKVLEPVEWRVPTPETFGEVLDELATALVASCRGMLFSSLWNWQIATLKCSGLKCF